MPNTWALFCKINKCKFCSDYKAMHALIPAPPPPAPPPATDIKHLVDTARAFLAAHAHLPCLS